MDDGEGEETGTRFVFSFVRSSLFDDEINICCWCCCCEISDDDENFHKTRERIMRMKAILSTVRLLKSLLLDMKMILVMMMM